MKVSKKVHVSIIGLRSLGHMSLERLTLKYDWQDMKERPVLNCKILIVQGDHINKTWKLPFCFENEFLQR